MARVSKKNITDRKWWRSTCQNSRGGCGWNGCPPARRNSILSNTSGLGGNVKGNDLANFSPKELWELSTAARKALIKKRRRPKLIRAFWRQTELDLSGMKPPTRLNSPSVGRTLNLGDIYERVNFG